MERMKYVIYRTKTDYFEIPVMGMYEDKKKKMINFLATEINSGHKFSKVVLKSGNSVVYSVYKRGNTYYLKTKDGKENVLKIVNSL